MRIRLAPLCAAAVMAFAGATVHAHDTWFERLPSQDDAVLLALGTGNVYPLYDSGIDARYLARQGCRAGPRVEPLRPVRNEPTTLLLRAAADASTCWAQLTPFEVELAPDKIELYLGEINATPEVRALWAGIHARGLPWKERYTKNARILLPQDPANHAAQRTPLSLDVLIENAPQALRGAEPVRLQVLRDGRPLPNFAIQLRSNQSALGIWRRTDGQGRAEIGVPFPGQWVLRGVDLRLSTSQPDAWESRFVTLAFQVRPPAGPADQKTGSFRSNALSTSQIAATSAITSEPPTSTALR